MSGSYVRRKEVSCRLMKPTLAHVDVELLTQMVHNWQMEWQHDASVNVFDEGVPPYSLVDHMSHHKFYGAVCLAKAALKCSLVAEEPEDVLDNTGNVIVLSRAPSSTAEQEVVDALVKTLSKRGYKFAVAD